MDKGYDTPPTLKKNILSQKYEFVLSLINISQPQKPPLCLDNEITYSFQGPIIEDTIPALIF